MSDTYQFRCPACGAERTAPQSIVGRRVRCSECNTLVTAPPPSGERERQLSDTWEPDGAAPAGSAAPPTAAPPTAAHPIAAPDFDPYYKWLAIPPSEQPPNHYRLLGVPLFEADLDVIEISADRQMAHIKAQATGRHGELSQRLLNELANASSCLLETDRKEAYDAQLRRELKRRAAEKKSRPPAKQAATPREVLRDSTPPGRPVGSGTVSGFAPLSLADLEAEAARAASAAPPAAEARAPDAAASGAAARDARQRVADAAPKPVPQPSSAKSAPPPAKPAPPPAMSPLRPAPTQAAPLVSTEAASDDDAGDMDAEEGPLMLRRERSRESVDDEMDMTPMVDVTFLLLIFFMVTMSFALQRSKQLPAPEEQEESAAARTIEDFEEDPNVIIVRVDSYSTFHVTTPEWEQEAPSEQELLIKLREARQGSGGVVPSQLLVIANGEAVYERVVMALDAGAAVEMESIKLVTVEEDDE